ncbi:hypothetical protein [Microbulbifer sp.]|uniref:hypothetical protein n=1 Tax=Microbulbifer sp. TaxID=1908541 RepID=UPI002F94E82E
MNSEDAGKPVNPPCDVDELQALAEMWRQTPVAVPVPEVIRTKIRTQERRMRLYALLEWGLSIALCSVGVYLILSGGRSDAPWLGLLLVILTGWAMAFSVSSRRGLWSPLEESTRAYLDLALLRLVHKRRMLRFAWILFIAELGIFALWQWLSRFGWLEPIFAGDATFALSWISAFALGMGIWSAWYWRGIKNSEQQIAKWQRENIQVSAK